MAEGENLRATNDILNTVLAEVTAELNSLIDDINNGDEDLDKRCPSCSELLSVIKDCQNHIMIKYSDKILLHHAHKQYGSKFSALHAACILNKLEVIEQLVKRGVDVNVQTSRLYSPLHVLARGYDDRTDIIDYLASHGADLYLRNDRSQTPLDIAIEKSNVSFVKCILKYPYNVNASDILGSTPLIEAASHECIEIVELLLNNGADPNIVSRSNELAIHSSISPGNGEMFKYLLEKTDFDFYNKSKNLCKILQLIICVEATDCLEILINTNCSKYILLNDETTFSILSNQICRQYEKICFIGYLLNLQILWPSLSSESWEQMLAIMVKNGLPVNSVSADCMPPLSVTFLSCRHRMTNLPCSKSVPNPEIYITALLKHGVDVNYPDASEPEALLNAFRYGNDKAMLLLLQHSEFATPDSVIKGYMKIQHARYRRPAPEVLSLFFKIGISPSSIRLLSEFKNIHIPTEKLCTLQQLCRTTVRDLFYSKCGNSNLSVDEIMKRCNLPRPVRDYLRYRNETLPH